MSRNVWGRTQGRRYICLAIDSFTVSLHNPNGKHLHAMLRLWIGTANGLWKTKEITTGHVISKYIAAEAIPT